MEKEKEHKKKSRLVLSHGKAALERLPETWLRYVMDLLTLKDGVYRLRRVNRHFKQYATTTAYLPCRTSWYSHDYDKNEEKDDLIALAKCLRLRTFVEHDISAAPSPAYISECIRAIDRCQFTLTQLQVLSTHLTTKPSFWDALGQCSSLRKLRLYLHAWGGVSTGVEKLTALEDLAIIYSPYEDQKLTPLFSLTCRTLRIDASRSFPTCNMPNLTSLTAIKTSRVVLSIDLSGLPRLEVLKLKMSNLCDKNNLVTLPCKEKLTCLKMGLTTMCEFQAILDDPSMSFDLRTLEFTLFKDCDDYPAMLTTIFSRFPRLEMLLISTHGDHGLVNQHHETPGMQPLPHAKHLRVLGLPDVDTNTLRFLCRLREQQQKDMPTSAWLHTLAIQSWHTSCASMDVDNTLKFFLAIRNVWYGQRLYGIYGYYLRDYMVEWTKSLYNLKPYCEIQVKFNDFATATTTPTPTIIDFVAEFTKCIRFSDDMFDPHNEIILHWYQKHDFSLSWSKQELKWIKLKKNEK